MATTRTEDLTGQTFHQWSVLRRAQNHGRAAFWLCRCSCGTEREVSSSSLRNNRTHSCGCTKSEEVSRRFLRHGGAVGRKKSPEYGVWSGMKGRCYNPKGKWYHVYGGKGIRVCDRWLGPDGFANFLADMGPRPSAEHSIERKNSDLDYYPSNCEWATAKTQSRNTNRNRVLEYAGETRCVAEWAELRGIPRKTLMARLNYGWSVAEALEYVLRNGPNFKRWT